MIKKVYQSLTQHGFNVWMDIYGGMYGDINEAMAAGVEGAGIILPFLTEKYEMSKNCKRELSYANKRNVEVVPCMAQPKSSDGEYYDPSGWLGVLTASLLYTDFRRVEAFEESMAMLVAELKKQAEVNGLDLMKGADQAVVAPAEPVKQVAPVRSGIDCEWSTKNFIQYFHGSTKSKILITVSHGGKVKAGSIPDRTVECCNGSVAGCKTSKQPVTTSGSVNTIEFGMALRENLGVLTGEKAHLVVNHLHRSKMDGNREINNAAQHDPDAEDAWEDYQEFISTARRAISETGGGVLFDVIGNTRKQVELGYLLFSNGLKKSDDQLDYSISSVKNLVEARGVKFSDVVRGDISLGTLIQTQGLDAVPSLGNPVPESGYGSGGYTVKQWGSKFGGDVDAIHLGLPSGVRKGYKESAPKIAKAIVQFMTVYG